MPAANGLSFLSGFPSRLERRAVGLDYNLPHPFFFGLFRGGCMGGCVADISLALNAGGYSQAVQRISWSIGWL